MGLKITNRLAEVELAGQPEPMNGPCAGLPHVNLVDVGFQYVVFLVMELQQQRHQGFVALAQQGLIPGQEEVLHQLLGQRAAPLHDLPGPDISQHCPANR